MNRQFLFTILFFLAATFSAKLYAQDASFDVASMIECTDVEKVDEATQQPIPTGARLIHIPLWISTDFDEKVRSQVAELRIDFQFLQGGNEVHDFSPRTDTHSNIVGPVTIENHRKHHANFGINLSGSYQPVKGTLNSGLGAENKTIEKYQKTPDRQLASAAGTRHRRTGVYFKFLSNPQMTLDGEKQLSIIARVPKTWRGGLARVKIRAQGKRQRIPGIKEDYKIAEKIYQVALVRPGDHQAASTLRQFQIAEVKAMRLVRGSSDFRADAHWNDFRNGQSAGRLETKDLNRWLVRPRLTESDRNKIKRIDAADRESILEFIEARQAVLELNAPVKVAARSDAAKKSKSNPPSDSALQPMTNLKPKAILKPDPNQTTTNLGWVKKK